MQKKQYAAIDLMKFVAAIGVIVAHCNLPYISAITRIGLELFFTASAYFLFCKLRQKFSLQEYLLPFLKHIGRLYIIWTIIYLPLSIYDIVHQESLLWGSLAYIKNIFLNGSYWQLWFLHGLMVSVALVFLGIKKGISYTNMLLLALLTYSIGGFSFTYSWLYDIILADCLWLNRLTAVLKLIFGTPINGFVFGLIFVLIGAYIGMKQPFYNRRFLWKSTIFSWLALFSEQFLVDYFHPEAIQAAYLFMPVTVYFTFLLLLSSNLQYKNLYAHLRKLSMYLFYTHTYFIFIYNQLFSPEGYMDKFIFTFLMSLLVGELLIFLEKHNKVFRYLT